MKNTNYITLQGWMINEMKLQGNELLIYGIIFGFSQAEGTVFKGSIKYLEVATNSTRNTVRANLKKLEDKGFVERGELVIGNKKINTFNALYCWGSNIAPLCETCQELTCECQNLTKEGVNFRGSEIDPNNTITNNTKIDTTNDITNSLLSEIEISDVEESQKDYFEIAKIFQVLIKKNIENKKSSAKKIKEATFKNWVTPIRLLFEKDEATKESLREIYRYLDSPAGDFWSEQILSTTNLRKHFIQLSIKAHGKKEQITTDPAERAKNAAERYYQQSTAGN